MADFYSDIIVRVAVFLYALWIGGLATTIFNRVPNEIPIGPTQKPRCNNCGNEIKFKYFFPVLGYFFSNGKCIHCGMKIPRVYLGLELAILCYILLLSLTFNSFDEAFISKSLYGSFLIVLMFIYYANKQIKIRLVWMLVAFILAYRGYNNTLPDVIDLFISGVVSYGTFTMLKKHIQINLPELEVSVILFTSFGYVISLSFCLVVMFFKIINRISFIKQIKKIQNDYIVYIPLIIGVLLSFF